MKSILLSGFFGFFTVLAFGQAQLGRVEYQKKDRQAVMIYTQFPADVMADAIADKMEKLGNKGKSGKSFLGLGKDNFVSYKNAQVPELRSGNSLDLYFKTERKSRKESDASIIYMLIGKGTDDFATSDSDPELIENAKYFLNDLMPFLEAYNLEVEIKKQDDVVSKAEKKLKNMQDDQKSLEKKIQDLQDKLKQNEKDQNSQENEIEKQKSLLEAMKAKRKGS